VFNLQSFKFIYILIISGCCWHWKTASYI